MSKSGCLETRELRFSYPDGPTALHGISLDVKRGDFVAVIGQNGSGKTTLAKHFNGLLRPDAGKVCLFGEDIANRKVSELAQDVGYVFQNPDHQIFSATVREEIDFGPRNLGCSNDMVGRRTEEAIEYFGLGDVADCQPAVLGFGLRRKVSIAAVYAMKTPVLILDEPTSGLDLKSTNELMAVISELHRLEHTIILITHDMRVVAEYVPHCMVMRGGEILAYDVTREIFKNSELLLETQIAVPQISELGNRMTPYGMPDDVLTVPEFSDEYNRILLGQEEGKKNADRR